MTELDPRLPRNGGTKKITPKTIPTPKYGTADAEERKRVFTPVAAARAANGEAPTTYDSWLNEQSGKGQAILQLQQQMASQGPSAGLGAGGSGGYGSSAGASKAAAQAGIQTLWSLFQQPDQVTPNDPSMGQNLDRIAGEATQQGNSAVDQLKGSLQGQFNPYAQSAGPTAQVTANPLADYMQQSGASTAGVDALRQMLASGAADSQRADQSNMDRMAQSWAMQQQGSLQDAETSRAAFAQSVANNKAGYGTQIAAQDKQRQQAEADKNREYKDNLRMQIIQLAVQNGINIADLGITL